MTSVFLLLSTGAVFSGQSRAAAGVAVIKPAAGDVYRVGDTLVVQWTQTQDDGGMTFRLSPDTGLSYLIIGTVNAGTDSYNSKVWRWAVADSVFDAGHVGTYVVSDACMLKVHGYFKEVTLFGFSGLFSIKSAANGARNPRNEKRLIDYAALSSQRPEVGNAFLVRSLFDVQGRSPGEPLTSPMLIQLDKCGRRVFAPPFPSR